METTPIIANEIPRNKFWGLAVTGEDYRQFKTVPQLLKFMKQRARTIKSTYYHHDYEICQLMTEEYVPREMRVRGARVIRANVEGADWINSYALFPSPLADILEAAGYKKHPMKCKKHECEDHVFDVNCSQCFDAEECKKCYQALEKRNYSDTVEALEAFMEIGDKYEKGCGLHPIRGGFTTAASCAFSAAEIHSGPITTDLRFHDAYRGGRVEAFRLGDCGKATCFDINSSYPYAFLDAPKEDTLIRAIVTLDMDGACPFFYYREEYGRENALIFPRGSFETMFFASNYEKYIRKFGGIRRMEIVDSCHVDLSWLQKTSELVKPIYDERMKAKKAGDLSTTYAFKIFLNSIYGRLGMKPEREICYVSDKIPEIDCSSYPISDYKFLIFQSSYNKPRANYLMAAWITDNARARLYYALKSLNPFYCDTDSIYVKARTKIPKNFPLSLGNELGDWKEEESEYLNVVSVKDYEFGAKVKRKGGDHSDIWSIKRAVAGKPVLGINKTRRSNYDKREVYSDGSTHPLTVWG